MATPCGPKTGSRPSSAAGSLPPPSPGAPPRPAAPMPPPWRAQAAIPNGHWRNSTRSSAASWRGMHPAYGAQITLTTNPTVPLDLALGKFSLRVSQHSAPVNAKGGKQTAAGAAWRLSEVAGAAIASGRRREWIWGVGDWPEAAGVAAGETLAFSSGGAWGVYRALWPALLMRVCRRPPFRGRSERGSGSCA